MSDIQIQRRIDRLESALREYQTAISAVLMFGGTDPVNGGWFEKIMAAQQNGAAILNEGHVRIFLDDTRDPPFGYSDAIVVRGYHHMVNAVMKLYNDGKRVRFISFDHDLGTEWNGKHCAEIFYDMWIRDMDVIADDFQYDVHSQNPVGAANIRAYMNNFLEFREKNPRKKTVDR